MSIEHSIEMYAAKFIEGNNNINDLSDESLDNAFKNCVSTTVIKKYYPEVREQIFKMSNLQMRLGI